MRWGARRGRSGLGRPASLPPDLKSAAPASHGHHALHARPPSLQSLGHAGVPDDCKLNLGKLVLDGGWCWP